MLLLNPGPVTLSERVRRSLLQPDLCHRESEFFDLQDEVRSGLLSVYELEATGWSAVLMSGSGTAAVESMLTALVPENGRILIAENGVYGERMTRICAQYRIPHECQSGPWLQSLDFQAISQRLRGGAFSHLGVVHHETTSGRLNELPRLAQLCRESGTRLLVDAVSSYGAETLDFNDEAIAAVAATANKCLHGVPGIAFVIARRTELARAVSRTYYLDLDRLSRMQDRRNTPFTPAVHAYYAMAEALREFAEEGGRPARYERYRRLAEQLREGLARLGIDTIIPAEQSSVVLRAYRLPNGMSYERLHDALKARGFVIYAGQGDLAKSLFRIATMGQVSSADISRLLTCCADLH